MTVLHILHFCPCVICGETFRCASYFSLHVCLNIALDSTVMKWHAGFIQLTLTSDAFRKADSHLYQTFPVRGE